MAFNKITDADVQNVYVQGAPDRLTGTAQQNKAIFDNLPLMIKDKINIMVDLLNSITEGNSGADNIGATPLDGRAADTIQGILEELGLEADAANRLVTLFETITEIGAVNNSPARLCTAQDIVNYISVIGGGDMLKAAYDPNNNGDKVAKSEDADALGGIPAADYMQYADLDAEPTEDSTNGVKSGGVFTAIKNAKEALEQKLYHRNPLDNPYFKINQKDGYFLPANTPYYSDTALSTLAGTTTQNTIIYLRKDNGGYESFYLDVAFTTQYYVASNTCIKGYLQQTNKMSVDGWFYVTGTNTPLLINADGSLKLQGAALQNYIYAKGVDMSKYYGAPYTFSARVKGKGAIQVYGGYANVNFDYDDWEIVSTTYTMPQAPTGDMFKPALIVHDASSTFDVSHTKLESGEFSTLQNDIDNDVYNQDLDLYQCQRKFIRLVAKSRTNQTPFGYGNVYSGRNAIEYALPVPTSMEKRPTVTPYGKVVAQSTQGSISLPAGTPFATDDTTDAMVAGYVLVTIPSNWISSETIQIRTSGGDGYIEIDAY